MGRAYHNFEQPAILVLSTRLTDAEVWPKAYTSVHRQRAVLGIHVVVVGASSSPYMTAVRDWLKRGEGMSTKCDSRNIPLPIQRELRQRCGFGCVICGLPLYHYHHIKDWANVHEHIAADIILLCDKHHGETTLGLLPKEEVIEANKSPFNLQTGRSRPLLMHYEGNSCEIHMGSNSFTTRTEGRSVESFPLMVDGIPLIGFRFEADHLFLNFILFDQFNHLVLRIIDNHLFYSISPWDIQFVGKTITIREKSRKFLIRLTFQPPNKVTIDKGRFLCNGVEILVYSDHIIVANNNTWISGCRIKNAHGGLIIGRTPKRTNCFMRLGRVDRYLGDSKTSSARAKSVKEKLTD